jgi:hypothetical protein
MLDFRGYVVLDTVKSTVKTENARGSVDQDTFSRETSRTLRNLKKPQKTSKNLKKPQSVGCDVSTRRRCLPISVCVIAEALAHTA